MIQQRRLVYVMGFDPRGSAFYYQLLKREAQRAGRRHARRLQISPLQPDTTFSRCEWHDQQGIQGDYRFAEMLDLILPHFRAQPGSSWLWWWQLVLFLATPTFWRHQPRPFALFLLYPLISMLLLLGCASISSYYFSLFFSLWSLPCWLLVMLALIDKLLQQVDHRLYIRYLLGDFLFTKAILTAEWPDLEQRLQHWAQQLSDDITALDDTSELVIVGHSSGGLLAARLAALVQQQIPIQRRAQCCLMTLGNQASTGFATNTAALLQACAELTQSDALPWVEVFAPQDVICSGRFDAGTLPNARRGKIKLQSALFKEALSSAEYQRQRRQFFQAHLQYLRSSTTGYGFDFIACMTSNTPCAAYQPRRDPSIKPQVQ